MNCEQARKSSELLLMGKLSGQAARDVRMHLGSCAACRTGLNAEQWAEVLPALDETIEPSGNFALQFRAMLESRPEPWWEKIATWGWPRRLAAAGVLAAAILAGILTIHSPFSANDRAITLENFAVAENLPLLEDMAVVCNLDLLEDFDIIEDLPRLMDPGVKN